MKKRFPRRVAYVKCKGKPDSGQQNTCSFGCLGCGACVEACRLKAIHLEAGQAAVVDDKKCVNCGLCIKACPQGIISSRIADLPFEVCCSNREKGVLAKDVCLSSCLGCGICERNCPSNAIHVIENCAQIRQTDCLSCGFCMTKCPRGCIEDIQLHV